MKPTPKASAERAVIKAAMAWYSKCLRVDLQPDPVRSWPEALAEYRACARLANLRRKP